MKNRWLFALGLALLCACASPRELEPDAPLTLTLSPQSGERGLEETLRSDEFDAPSPVSAGEARKAHPAHSPAADAEAIYACPMHPEVTSATPGQCPKCGMQLVPKKEK